MPVRKVSMKSYFALRRLDMTCPGSDSGKPFFKIPDKTTFCINDHIKLVLWWNSTCGTDN